METAKDLSEKITDSKKNFNNFTLFASIILFLVCIFQTVRTNQFSEQNKELENKISEFESKNRELSENSTILQKEKDEITEKYDALNLKYSTYVTKVNNYVENRRAILYTSPNTTPSGSYIETRIDGEFEGWEGETIFKMQNGTIWQQASYAYKYKYAYSPKVLIFGKSDGTYMKVDGINDEIRVRRIK